MADGPPITVEVAFDGGPNSDTYTWTDISAWVTGLSVKRGRNSELDRVEAGTLSLALDNSDGRFTPGKRITGDNALAGNPNPVTFALDGRADNTSVHGLGVNVSPDGTARVVSRTVATNGPRVACYFAIAWQDASGTTVRFVAGTRFVADGYAAVYTHSETPPANAVKGTVWVYAESYPDGNNGVSLTLSNPTWHRGAPYYPNVLPRRRVRVRTANLLPKDVATGGDISRSSAMFNTSHVTGGWNNWMTTPKSGAGAVCVGFGSNGTADFSSSVKCGFTQTVTTGPWWRRTSNAVPVGLAKVIGGAVYTASAQVQLGASAPATSVVARIRWYNSAGSLISTSSASSAVALVSGTYVPIALTGQLSPTGAAWAGVEIGSAGGDNGAYIFVDEIQLEQGAAATAWTPGGSIFSGYVEKWPVKVDSMTATVELPAVDGFLVLGDTELHTPYQQAILTSEPVGYWTLGDAAGSTRVENLANDVQPGALVGSKYGKGTPLFGADSIVKRDSDTTCYSLANVASNKGSVVDLNDAGRRTYPLGDTLTVAFWALPTQPAAGNMVTLFQAWDDAGLRLISFRLDSFGYLQVETGFADGSSNYLDTVISGVTLSTSSPSFIVATVAAGQTNLILNGVPRASSRDVPTSNDLRDMKWSSVAGQQAGSIYTEYANGRYGHVAVWDRVVSQSEISDFWGLADNGGAEYAENEATRLSRISRFADFTGEFVADAGLSALLTPTWDDGATALDEVQLAAGDGSGYVFMDGDGRLTFHNRQRRQSAPVRYVLSDSAGTPYEPGLEFEMDEDQVVNEVAYKRPNGVDSTVRDNTSIRAYGRKTKSIELRVTTDTAVLDAAYSLLTVYANPIVRCDQVTLNVTATPALYPIVLGIEIGDRITLGDLPASAPASSFDFYVEAIDTEVHGNGTAPEWTTTLSLSPAGATDVWVLEDPTLGRLDGPVGLAY
ncbi:LamG-like jellyroll fold domain-containing protein [Streptomyces lydicamycinicus]|uniref:LamG-like jellyroll fold domain-containing protein n=1 Tax=Streptomyces lydicamycinicus TaxID=1546107 RepID=UPI003C2E5F8E